MTLERMYVVKARNHEVDYECSYYYMRNALNAIKFLHDRWPNLTCTLSLKNDVDPDLYRYDINTEVNKMKLVPILARELKPGDKFKLNQHDFTPIYELECIFGDHIDGVDARTDCRYHCSVNKTDIVYKVEEDN